MTPDPYPPGFARLAPRLQVIWLHFRGLGPQGGASSPVHLQHLLGGGPQHYTAMVRTLAHHQYLLPTGRGDTYRGRQLPHYRACTPGEYARVIPLSKEPHESAP
ncbi:hypothetical protein [Deinococcus petrolearius]|uniref:Uncharacterized protein n=1 Tax=Deinococcus petrolearius TaxID=1751295 RepID=A0ABW1DMY3_9DEIO